VARGQELAPVIARYSSRAQRPHDPGWHAPTGNPSPHAIGAHVLPKPGGRHTASR